MSVNLNLCKAVTPAGPALGRECFARAPAPAGGIVLGVDRPHRGHELPVPDGSITGRRCAPGVEAECRDLQHLGHRLHGEAVLNDLS